MKLLVVCMKCSMTFPDKTQSLHGELEVRDDGMYHFTCRLGHNNFVVLQNPKYEILFEFGLNAIADGYYRDAVSSFAASLERFHEFVIRVCLTASGVDAKVREDAWRLLNNSSEMQSGAYVATYTSVMHMAPALLSTKSKGFRNSVIHKGTIPNAEEALEFGETIRDLVEETSGQLQAKIPDVVRKVTFALLNERASKVPTGTMVTTHGLNTALSANEVGNLRTRKEPLMTFVHGIKKMREMYRQSIPANVAASSSD